MRRRDYYNKKQSPWLRWLLMAVLTVIMVYAACQLIGYAVQANQARSLRAELAAVTQQDEVNVQRAEPAPTQAAGDPVIERPVESGTPTPAPATQLRNSVSASAAPRVNPNQPPEILISYYGLHQRNPDMVGWLNMDALAQVDLPVVQRDNTYYLRRDFDGRSNINGTAFLDKACSIWPRSDNLIIYAHNMKNGEMFGGLHKLMKEIFYREHPMTSFNTIYERGQYVPVAVVLCSIYRDQDDFFNFYVTDFKSEAAFDKYVSQARDMSEVDSPYDVRYGDDLLTLVTCYDEAHTKRLLVILRRVRADENPEELAGMWE